MFTLYNEHPGRDTSHDPDGSHYEYIAIVLFRPFQLNSLFLVSRPHTAAYDFNILHVRQLN